jgi:hypothetical protein
VPSFPSDSGLVIKAADIKVLYAPLYKGLNIATFLEQGGKDERVQHYFPDLRDIHRLPRQFVVNVVFTVVGKPISDWVSEGIKARNDQLAENRHLLIELDPAIAEAF